MCICWCVTYVKLYMFRTVPLSIISSFFYCKHSNGIRHTGLLTACEEDQDGTSWSCSQDVWHIPLLCVQWKSPDDGQRNCPKHVEFYSKNKFEKLVHLVGFIIGISETGRLHSCCGHETENTVLLWNHQTSYNKELLGKFGADDYVAESTTDNALRSC